MSERQRRAPRARVATIAVVLLLSLAATAGAHDLFLRATSFFAAPNSAVTVRLLNGTFDKSEAPVEADRLRDASVVSPAGRAPLDTSTWRIAGDKTSFTVRTGVAGTYVVGISTKPRELTLAGKAFAAYLAADGIDEVLAARKANGTLADSARERYEKHAKLLLQVGAARSAGILQPLGYPAELVPLDNPYDAVRPTAMRLRVLVDGRPQPGQVVLAGGRTRRGARVPTVRLRADNDGLVTVPLKGMGPRYVQFIRMVPTTDGGPVHYHSKWATLTFELR